MTARKRSESLQRVPVAVTTQTGTQLEQQRITQPIDLQHIVPSLQITLASGNDNSAVIALRGQQASDTLLGESQPVGLYEDSVNEPHPFGSNNAFFDLSRVEVLKGPQGTLYGRNTTGGAINIITRNADYNGFHGFAEAEVGNFNDVKGGFAVNLPIIDDVLAVRVAYQHWSQQGFGQSIVTGEHFGNDHDDDLARISVKFDPLPNLDITLKGEYTQALHNGAMISDTSLSVSNPAAFYPIASEALVANPALASDVLAIETGAGTAAQQAAVYGAGLAELHGCVANLGGSFYKNCSATHQFDNLHTWHGALDIKWNITGDITLRSITGVHSIYDINAFDLDSVQAQLLEVGVGNNGIQPDVVAQPGRPISPAPFALGVDQADTQWTQELNLTGKSFDDHLDWLLGAFGSWDKGNGSQPSLAATELTYYTGGSLSTSSNDIININQSTWALFTQDDVHLTDQFSITLGARYTEEKLDQDLSNWLYYFNGPQAGTYACSFGNGAPPIPTNPLSCDSEPAETGAGTGIAYQHARSDGTSYLLSFNFQLTHDMLLYVKTSRGFRGGAFGRSPQPAAKPEIDTDYEIGFKGDFFDHRLRTNLAGYITNYENKQFSLQECLPAEISPPASGCPAGQTNTTAIINAASARIEGVELEWQAAPFRGLSIYGTASYTYGYFINFPNAPAQVGPLAGQTYNAENQNIGGQPIWQGNVGARYEHPLAAGVAGIQVDYTYRGAIPLPNIPEGIDPNVPVAVQTQGSLEGAVGLVNARIDYKVPSQGLTFALWGTNLGNVKWGYQGITSAYTGTLGTEVDQPPLTFGFSVKKTFGGD